MNIANVAAIVIALAIAQLPMLAHARQPREVCRMEIEGDRVVRPVPPARVAR